MTLERLVNWWFDWSDRMYHRSCGTIWWRFWFEVTGQGHGARRYMRDIYRQRWWETHRRARKRHSRNMRAWAEAYMARNAPETPKNSPRSDEQTESGELRA